MVSEDVFNCVDNYALCNWKNEEILSNAEEIGREFLNQNISAVVFVEEDFAKTSPEEVLDHLFFSGGGNGSFSSRDDNTVIFIIRREDGKTEYHYKSDFPVVEDGFEVLIGGESDEDPGVFLHKELPLISEIMAIGREQYEGAESEDILPAEYVLEETYLVTEDGEVSQVDDSTEESSFLMLGFLIILGFLLAGGVLFVLRKILAVFSSDEEDETDSDLSSGQSEEAEQRTMRLLTERDVTEKQFKTLKFMEGYDQVEVDTFLKDVITTIHNLSKENKELEKELSELNHWIKKNNYVRPERSVDVFDETSRLSESRADFLTARDVVEVRFRSVKFRESYDQIEVDEFLDDVVATIHALNKKNVELNAEVEDIKSFIEKMKEADQEMQTVMSKDEAGDRYFSSSLKDSSQRKLDELTEQVRVLTLEKAELKNEVSKYRVEASLYKHFADKSLTDESPTEIFDEESLEESTPAKDEVVYEESEEGVMESEKVEYQIPEYSEFVSRSYGTK